MSKFFRLVFLAAVLGLTGVASFDSRNFSPDAGVSEKRTASQLFWRSAGTTGWTQSKPEGLLQPISATTNNTISLKLSDIPVGKVIQVGESKFVKVSSDQYISITPSCDDGLVIGGVKTFTYTGRIQEFKACAGHKYQIELWGASGGKGLNQGRAVTTEGLGSYVSGSIIMPKNTTLYLQLGQVGYTGVAYKITSSAYNGGGYGDHDHTDDESSGSGGGATDVRIIGGSWDNAESLRSRIMVAGGGGGGGYYKGTSGAGGLIGYNSNASVPVTNQTTGYAFGIGGFRNEGMTGSFGIGGGGGGWYGGTTTTRALASSTHDGWTAGYDAGTGGSSYISGHTGCVAVTSTSSSSPKSGCTTGTTDNSCSISPYGYVFTDTIMIDGQGKQWTNVIGSAKVMPIPFSGNYGSNVGHTGNGYARITRLN